MLLCGLLPAESVPSADADDLGQLSAARAGAPRPRDLIQLFREYRGLTDVPLLTHSEGIDARVGRIETFWMGDQGTPRHFQVQAELRLITRHAYWYVQQGMSISDSALGRASESFERVIYPNVRRLVGSESFPGFDNDPRITILNGNVPGVAGYVSSLDSYPRTVSPFSNEREIVYLNTRSVEPGSVSYLSVLAHEFAHMVHGAVSSSEATWLKEGTADAVATRVLPERAPTYGAFFARPDLQVTAWGEGPAGAQYYESAALFVRYFLDRFGDEALYPFLRRPGFGMQGIDAFLAGLGQPDGFEGLFRDWVGANLIGTGVTAEFPLYRSSLNGSPRTQRLNASGRISETVTQFGADYYELGPGVGGLRFSGAPAVRPLAASPYSGSAVWYGGREDAVVASMTRRFDLSGLSRAELGYWTWYDIETDYDYGYVSISNDDGRTWTMLTGPGMSSNPESGNNLGRGYTGRSGGSERPAWVQASHDLTRFVGSQVLLRFSYVTDDAVTREGIAIDDIEVAALGVFDGAEEDTGVWELEGWTRSPAVFNQRWSVQVLVFSGGQVEREIVVIDSHGNGAWNTGARQFDRAVAVISGVTPNTLQAASYSLEAF